MYRAGEVSVHRACCERATQSKKISNGQELIQSDPTPNPTRLEGEVRFDQAQDQQVVTTRSPRIVTECLLTRSMLIKMYVFAIYSRFRIGTIFQKAWIYVYHYTITMSLNTTLSQSNCMNIVCQTLFNTQPCLMKVLKVQKLGLGQNGTFYKIIVWHLK